MDWCVQRRFDYNTLVVRTGNYMREDTSLVISVRSAGDFCCDRLASRRYGVRVSTRPSQGRNPGSNPGIATTKFTKPDENHEIAVLPQFRARSSPLTMLLHVGLLGPILRFPEYQKRKTWRVP